MINNTKTLMWIENVSSVFRTKKVFSSLFGLAWRELKMARTTFDTKTPFLDFMGFTVCTAPNSAFRFLRVSRGMTYTKGRIILRCHSTKTQR